MDEASLERQFYQAWLDLGSLRFLKERVEPFVHALGDGWQKGELCVADEHFGSEKIGDFMAGIWRRLNEHNEAGPVLLSTLPGDNHRLGLQMVALVSAMAGLKVIYLGPSTPIEEVLRVSERVAARAVLISVALGADAEAAARQLLALSQNLKPSVSLVAGGAGAPPAPAKAGRSWARFKDLDAYFAWARSLRQGRGPDLGQGAEARP
jgi:methanogenic corrinoid protein MtbC1